MYIKNNTKEEGSMTLGTVYGLGILSLALMATLLTSVLTNLSTHKNDLSGLHTLLTADANVREGIQQLLHDPAGYTGGTGVETNYVLAAGSDITVTPEVGALARVTGTASNALTERQVEYLVTLPVSSAVFDHAIFSENDLTIQGSASSTGDVYAAGDIDFNGNPHLDGDVNAAGNVSGGSTNHTGASNDGATPLIPPSIDTAPYQAQALADGTCYGCDGSGKTHTDAWIDYANGMFSSDSIIYFADPNESVSIQNWILTGTVIVEGDLHINSIDFSTGTSVGYDSSLVLYVGGDFHTAGNSAIQGLVYVEGDSAFGGGTVTIVGAFFSVDESSPVTVTGNIEVTYDPTLVTDLSDIVGLNTAVQIGTWTQL